MAIVETRKKLFIDLRGQNGNAFALLGAAGILAKDLGFTKEKTKEIQKQMTNGNYENLIAVFDENFGEHVDLLR